jgi:iron complex outermembrane recepter protein
MQHHKALVLLMTCCAWSLRLVAQDCHLALHGVVTEAETGEPIAFARLWVHELARGAQTDEHGHYTVADLCEGQRYTVEISHIGCTHETRVVELRENIALDIVLAHSHALEEVLVRERAMDIPAAQSQVRVSQLDLDANSGQNLGKTLRNLPGVSSLNTGATISKPVIQGLHSNRIAIVSNQVILEGQQWGSEHAPEIDPFTASTIKVVKGAAGVRYGVGAMGGAIILEPAPLRRQKGVGGWISTGGFSNGRGVVAAGMADWHLPAHNVTYRLQLTAKNSGNLHTPDYFLGNTGNRELNGLALANIKRGAWEHELSFARFGQEVAILGTSHLSDTARLQAAIRSEVPLFNDDRFTRRIGRPYQSVEHLTLKYRSTWRISERWKATAQYAWQRNRRREFDAHPPKSDPLDLEKKPQQSFRLWTNMLDLAVEHFPIRHWQGGVGAQVNQQINLVGKGGFIPDYTGWGVSLWAMERWRRFPVPWEFEIGLRADHRANHVTTDGRGTANLDLGTRFSNVSAALGTVYHLDEAWSLTLHSGLAWRPPHVNELFAAGVHHGASTYEKGNAALRPEKAWNSNFTVQYQQGEASFSLSAYHNLIRDFIYLNPQNRIVVTVRGPYPAYQYDQTQAATLQGLDGSLSLPVAYGLSLEGRVSVLRGRRSLTSTPGDATHRDWLPLMPADRFQYGLSWKKKRAANAPDGPPTPYVRLLGTQVLHQVRIPEEGLLKAAPAGFHLWDLDAGYSFRLPAGRHVELGLNVQNLFNARYREYLNFFRYFTDEPGTNIGLRVKMIF